MSDILYAHIILFNINLIYWINVELKYKNTLGVKWLIQNKTYRINFYHVIKFHNDIPNFLAPKFKNSSLALSIKYFYLINITNKINELPKYT